MKKSKEILFILIAFTFTLFFVLVINTVSYSADSCVNCHKDEKFRVQNKKLFDYFNKWKGSAHDEAGVSCHDCHGGDPARAKKEKAHANNLSPGNVHSMVFFKNIPKTCGNCHKDVYNHFVKSGHFRTLKRTGKGPNCVTCHGSLVTDVNYTSIVLITCARCHNQQTKNHPDIINTAEQILHRLNMSKAYLRWISIHFDGTNRLTEINSLRAQYQNISDSWHQFNFINTDKESEKLISELIVLFNEAYEKKEK